MVKKVFSGLNHVFVLQRETMPPLEQWQTEDVVYWLQSNKEYFLRFVI